MVYIVQQKLPAPQVYTQHSIASTAEDLLTFETLRWPYTNPIYVFVLYFSGCYAVFLKAIYGLFGKKPSINCPWFDGVSESGRAVRDGAATHQALDVVYNFKEGKGSWLLVRWIDWFWLTMRNAQAVRNRKKIVRYEICAAARRHAAPVQILSIACGSAQAVLEAMSDLRQEGVSTKLLATDFNRRALSHVKKLASERQLTPVVDVAFFPVLKDGQIVELKDRFENESRQIVEVAGLIDYLSDDQVVDLFSKIRMHVLSPGGRLITCHIHPNHEAFFLRHVVNWGMLYRTPEKLSELIRKAGFQSVHLHTEPHGIHSVAVATK